MEERQSGERGGWKPGTVGNGPRYSRSTTNNDETSDGRGQSTLLSGSGKRAKIEEHAGHDVENSIGTGWEDRKEVPRSLVRENGRGGREVPRIWAVSGAGFCGRTLLDTYFFWQRKRKRTKYYARNSGRRGPRKGQDVPRPPVPETEQQMSSGGAQRGFWGTS